jgi:hypothetical protein
MVTNNTCGGTYREVGPYNQTLFLGCSISNFNMSLGWSSDASTLTLSLVEDRAYHPSSSVYGPLKSRVTILNNSSNNPIESSALELKNNTSDKYYSIVTETGVIKTEYSKNSDTDQPTPDRHGNLHKDISKQLQYQFNEQNGELGKILWSTKPNNNNITYWTDPDPGFIGLPKIDNTTNMIIRPAYDIIGVPVYFKFDNGIEMGGYVQSWKTTGGQGGSPTYEVEVRSYSSLLNGVNLIINDYIGSISTNVNINDSTPIDSFNRKISTLAIPNMVASGTYNGSIAKGNIPNVINIFGYLENIQFGGSAKTSEGVSALQIYYAIKELLCNTTGPNHNPYSPYGCIVGKHLMLTSGENVNIIDSEIQSKSDGTIPVPQKISLAECGLCPNVMAVDGVMRSLLQLDIEELPIPPNDLYLSGNNCTLMSFIDTVCRGAGFDFYIDFEKSKSTQYSGIIKVRTVSRRTQPRKDIIKTVITNLLETKPPIKITSYSYGQSFTDQNTRALYIGGKQKRLYQALSTHLALKQNSSVFDPYANNGTGSFISVSPRYANYNRVPDAANTRRKQYSTDGGSSVAQLNTDKDFDTITSMGESLGIFKGNYLPTNNITTQDSTIANNPLLTSTTSYAIYKDLICPYFGNHGVADQEKTDTLSSAEPRKVFWDQNMGQLQIVFRTNDITTILSNPYYSTGEFIVLENEIRAAMAGFESWFAYCFDNIFTTDISDLMYTVFKNIYPAFASKDNFLAGLSVINWNVASKSTSKTQTNDPRPYAIKMEHAHPYVSTMYSDLQKIHNFFQDIGNENYGKKYMVRMPQMRWYQEGDLKLKFGNYAYSGGGKIFSDWEISSEGAWEEYGNMIDDTIVVGTPTSDLFTNDDGLIQPILGFNACGELASKDLWMNQNLNSANFDLNNIALVKARETISSAKGFYFPLKHSLRPDEYTYIPYVSPGKIKSGLSNVTGGISSSANIKTAHGISVPDNWVYKMYVKCSVDSKIVFMNNGDSTPATSGTIATTYGPRAIVSLSSPIFLGNGKNDTDESLSFVMLHDAICIKNRGATKSPGINSNLRLRYPGNTNDTWSYLLAWGLARNSILVGTNPNVSINSSSNNIPIYRKATCPAFAAIPVTFNRATYGPWINHPGLVGANIFPGYDEPGIVDNFVNNLVGGCKITENSEFVPWKYGGIDNLDASVMSQIKDDINYQQITEEGSIGIAGFVLTANDGNSYGLGDSLRSSASNLQGPIISNMNVRIGEGGITTDYNFRTYSRKIGFFNKENADRIQALGKETFDRKKQITSNINNSLGSIKQNTFSVSTNNGSSDTPKPLRWSPAEVLAGAAYCQVNPNSSITNIYKELAFSPDWFQRPVADSSVSYDPTNMMRYLTNVGVQDIQELSREFDKDYDRKSIMSLDGLLSPISFYPTPYGTTYNITKYTRERCPICQGKGVFTYSYLNIQSNTLPKSLRDLKNVTENVTKLCTFCESLEDKQKRALVSASPKETTPPYLLAEGSDLSLVNNLRHSGLSGNPIINTHTLNPILLSLGEFSCYQNRQSGDLTAHSIDVVGYGKGIPQGDNSLKPAYSNNPSKNFLDYDLNYKEYCASNKISAGVIPDNNMRFFGLRGPLMVHGWGYDLEGYPVPNSSGELLIQNNSFVYGTTEGSSSTGLIYKNQTQKPDGKWTKPYKENTFYKGWGQLPGTWPVGPIDLRWDDKAAVWTVGANYKPVWIKIETDLIENEPIRGVMIDDASNDPLPSGLRKLVYVKDSLGLNPAPRGAQIYCKYDSDNGFYEPIYNRPYITSGIIQNATAAEIYKLNDSGNIKYSTVYENPLNFNISNNDIGLFIFMDKSWILQSVRS